MRTKFAVRSRRGLTLVELLIYVTLSSLVFVAIAGLLQYTYQVNRALLSPARADRVGALSADRIMREIRTGSSVNVVGSSFATSTGVLDIDTIKDGVMGTSRFALSNGRITFQEDGGAVEYLTPEDVAVTTLSFHHLTSSLSEAVRFSFTIQFDTRSTTTEKVYSAVSLLRQSYE